MKFYKDLVLRFFNVIRKADKEELKKFRKGIDGVPRLDLHDRARHFVMTRIIDVRIKMMK